VITFLVSRGHEYTHRTLSKWADGPPVSVLSYDRLFRRRFLREAVYVFTDFDRLNHWELHLAATAFNAISASGWQPLNNPAQVRQRYALLRRLQEAGINDFGVYRVETGEMPQKYPVFLRNENGHTGPLTELISDRDQLMRAIEALVGAGQAEHHLIIVEYVAAPLRPNLFRKYAMYRIGDRLFPGISVHDETWQVRYGKRGLAGRELYEDEHALLRDNPFEEILRRAFELAKIEYGRADFGVVDGRPQIYEVNTNPSIRSPEPHPFPIREENSRLVWKHYLEALWAIDRNSRSQRLALLAPDLRRQQRWWYFGR
jgi:hypothetical protein